VSKLPVVSGAQCVKALEGAGFVVYRQRGTLLALIRQACLSVEKFIALL
jgi:hypothetical protein